MPQPIIPCIDEEQPELPFDTAEEPVEEEAE
jgi:hypothetical protein